MRGEQLDQIDQQRSFVTVLRLLRRHRTTLARRPRGNQPVASMRTARAETPATPWGVARARDAAVDLGRAQHPGGVARP
ncbi:hypothetical protein CAE01nite_30460 [Cellulomonas aerilata]|uniref:Uncharacterized protein n=1 Tax=Cellulomonas aerilata TaxID=515326 RepID=A0A512DFS7_9CELL|nr:hypothetical protein CAE01nite_30460 [Cellulomonas aerilata]